VEEEEGLNSAAAMARSKGDAAIADGWPRFVAAVKARLEIGARMYGDASFESPSDCVAVEIQQELLDVMGWGFILWERMQALEGRLAELEAGAAVSGPPRGAGPSGGPIACGWLGGVVQLSETGESG